MESINRDKEVRKNLDYIEDRGDIGPRTTIEVWTCISKILRELWYLLKDITRGDTIAPKFEAVIYSNKGDEFSSYFYIIPRVGEKVKILKDKELAVEVTLEVVDVIHIISRNSKSHLISMHGIER